jgi:hypothetical protein
MFFLQNNYIRTTHQNYLMPDYFSSITLPCMIGDSRGQVRASLTVVGTPGDRNHHLKNGCELNLPLGPPSGFRNESLALLLDKCTVMDGDYIELMCYRSKHFKNKLDPIEK